MSSLAKRSNAHQPPFKEKMLSKAYKLVVFYTVCVCVLLSVLLGMVIVEQINFPLRVFDGAAILSARVRSHMVFFIFCGLSNSLHDSRDTLYTHTFSHFLYLVSSLLVL